MNQPFVRGVHHVQVCCRRHELEATVAFYEQVLGMVRIARPTGPGWDGGVNGGGVWLAAGDAQLHVGVEEEVEADARRRTRTHAAYVVVDVGAAADRVREAGVEVQDDLPPIPGHRRVQFRDPAGNQVELIAAETA